MPGAGAKYVQLSRATGRVSSVCEGGLCDGVSSKVERFLGKGGSKVPWWGMGSRELEFKLRGQNGGE